MKVNLTVLHSCTIKRKKPWPKVAWLGIVTISFELNDQNFVVVYEFIFEIFQVKRTTVDHGLSANVADRSAHGQDETSRGSSERESTEIVRYVQHLGQCCLLRWGREERRFARVGQGHERVAVHRGHERVCAQARLACCVRVSERRSASSCARHESE